MDKTLTEFYINLIKAILKVYNESEKQNIQTKIVNRIFDRVFREYKNRIKLYVSTEAKEKAEKLGLKTLDEYSWREQVKASGMNDKGRKEFYLEHILPVSQTITNLFKATSDKDIKKILDEFSVAWITKEQQKKLDGKGGKKSKNSRGENLNEALKICSDFLNDTFISKKEGKEEEIIYKNYFKTKIDNEESIK